MAGERRTFTQKFLNCNKRSRLRFKVTLFFVVLKAFGLGWGHGNIKLKFKKMSAYCKTVKPSRP